MILFDMGNVLVDFVPMRFCAEITSDPKHISVLMYGVFYTRAWMDLDEGIITEEEALNRILDGLPESYHQDARELFERWDTLMPQKEAMLPILDRLKAKGYRLVLASNASIRYHRYIQRLSIFNAFETLYYSCDLKCSKPDPQFFQSILKREKLNADEILFVDDSLANCTAAHHLGMSTYPFNGDVNAFEETLEKMHVI